MLLIYPSHEGFSQPLPYPYEFSHQKENPLRLWVVPFSLVTVCKVLICVSLMGKY